MRESAQFDDSGCAMARQVCRNLRFYSNRRRSGGGTTNSLRCRCRSTSLAPTRRCCSTAQHCATRPFPLPLLLHPQRQLQLHHSQRQLHRAAAATPATTSSTSTRMERNATRLALGPAQPLTSASRVRRRTDHKSLPATSTVRSSSWRTLVTESSLRTQVVILLVTAFPTTRCTVRFATL